MIKLRQYTLKVITNEYGRHNTNSIGCRNICVVHRQLSVEILYGLQRNCRSDEKMSDKIMTECVICEKPYPEDQKPEEGEYWSEGCWSCYFKKYPDEA